MLMIATVTRKMISITTIMVWIIKKYGYSWYDDYNKDDNDNDS